MVVKHPRRAKMRRCVRKLRGRPEISEAAAVCASSIMNPLYRGHRILKTPFGKWQVPTLAQETDTGERLIPSFKTQGQAKAFIDRQLAERGENPAGNPLYGIVTWDAWNKEWPKGGLWQSYDQADSWEQATRHGAGWSVVGIRQAGGSMIEMYGAGPTARLDRMLHDPALLDNPAMGAVRGRGWLQESYESASGESRKRASALRKLGYDVTTAPLGYQVTPVGQVRVTLVNVRPGRTGDEYLERVPPAETVRWNPRPRQIPAFSLYRVTREEGPVLQEIFRRGNDAAAAAKRLSEGRSGRFEVRVGHDDRHGLLLARFEGGRKSNPDEQPQAGDWLIHDASGEQVGSYPAAEFPDEAGMQLIAQGFADNLGRPVTMTRAGCGGAEDFMPASNPADRRRFFVVVGPDGAPIRKPGGDIRFLTRRTADAFAEKTGGAVEERSWNPSGNPRDHTPKYVLEMAGYGPSDYPRVAKSPKRNPADTSADLYEEFHGAPPEETVAVEEEIHYHGHLAGLGELLEMKVRTLTGYQIVIGFTPDEAGLVPLLSSSEDGKQLYIRGGDQSLDLSAIKMDTDKWVRDSMVIGVVDEITYKTAKGFDKFIPTEYFHKLGEESGVQPLLVYDTLNDALSIVGGQYHVTAAGLEN